MVDMLTANCPVQVIVDGIRCTVCQRLRATTLIIFTKHRLPRTVSSLTALARGSTNELLVILQVHFPKHVIVTALTDPTSNGTAKTRGRTYLDTCNIPSARFKHVGTLRSSKSFTNDNIYWQRSEGCCGYCDHGSEVLRDAGNRMPLFNTRHSTGGISILENGTDTRPRRRDDFLSFLPYTHNVDCLVSSSFHFKAC